MRQQRAAERDISATEFHKPRHPRCRAKGENDLQYFSMRYFADAFKGGPLYGDQVEIITDVQSSILQHDDKALAAMRSGGKTSILRVALVWALLYGHSSYAALFGAATKHSSNHIKWIKQQLETNERLEQDFPEVCVPARHLEGSSRRAIGQTICGERTRIEWGQTFIIFPTISKELAPWSKCNGAIVEVGAMERGAVRGLNVYGKRPDLVLLDDVETRDSVKSADRTDEIMVRIETDIRGLGDTIRGITLFFLGTIMDEDSITSQLTDPNQNPTWHGKRYRFMITFPKAVRKWERYVELRREGATGPQRAQKFYKENRKLMDAGAVVAWPAGFDKKKEASAIERYYRFLADGTKGLLYCACELQNDPSMLEEDSERRITRQHLATRLSTLKRMVIPAQAEVIGGLVDVHHSVTHGHLFYMLVAWRKDFKGWVVDYGKWPHKRTVGERYKGDIESQVRQALDDLEMQLMIREYEREDGVSLNPQILVDSGAGQHQGAVFGFCRECQRRNFHPSKGLHIGKKDYLTIAPGAKVRGDHWHRSVHEKKKLNLNVIHFDANYYKTFILNRLFAPKGGSGALEIYGRDIAKHPALVKHLMSERRATVIDKASRQEYDEWRLPPAARNINHLWDCICGSAVAGAMQGCILPGTASPNRKRRARKTFKR